MDKQPLPVIKSYNNKTVYSLLLDEVTAAMLFQLIGPEPCRLPLDAVFQGLKAAGLPASRVNTGERHKRASNRDPRTPYFKVVPELWVQDKWVKVT